MSVPLVPPGSTPLAAAHPAPAPFSPEHLAAISAATHAARRVRRTAGVARASAWTTGVFGGVTLLGVLWGDLISLVLGGALLALAIREGKLGNRLARLDLGAPRLLAFNQLAFGGLILLYSLWQVWHAMNSSGLSDSSQPVGDAKVDAMLADFGSMVRFWTIGAYLCVGVLGALGTGLMALYYSRRTRMVRALLAQTPEWIVQTMRAAA